MGCTLHRSGEWDVRDRLAAFGTDLGVWIAKAARFQTGASEVNLAQVSAAVSSK